MSSVKHVISIGYGRNLFTPQNADRERMIVCANAGARVDMVIFTLATDNLKVEKVSDTLALHPTNSRSRAHMVFDAYTIAKNIMQVSPEKSNLVVTAQDPFEAGLVGWLLKVSQKVPLVVQEHGDVFSTPFWRRESFLNTLRFYMGWAILNRADVVRVVSKRTEAFLGRRGIKHITRLPVAISVTEFQHTTVVPRSSTFTIVSMARFVPQKNLSMLIRSFKTVHTAYPHSRLLLVGRGQEEQLLKKLVRDLFGESAPVSFLPWSNSPKEVFGKADVYALSSHYEGWGRVLIEAMVAQVPIVTTDVGCAHEVVKQDVHGIIIPINDEASFTAALIKMVSDTSYYTHIKTNLSQLQPKDIPGTAITEYGRAWLHSLTIDE